MIIFSYSIKPAKISPRYKGSFLRVSDNIEDNVTACFDGKIYRHTLPKEEIAKIIQIIQKSPELFNITELEPNNVLDGYQYNFTFSDGVRTCSFSGFNILDYGSLPRKNTTLALRAARDIKDHVL